MPTTATALSTPPFATPRAIADTSRREGALTPSLDPRLKGGEVAPHPILISLENFVRHVGLTKQGQENLGTVAVCDHPKGYVDHGTVFQFDPVVHDAESVVLCEADANPAFRTFRNPMVAILRQRRLAQPRSPARKTLRPPDRFIDLLPWPIDRGAQRDRFQDGLPFWTAPVFAG